MSRNLTLIYYHIPEDQETPDEPNAFAIPKPVDSLRLADIRSNFPVEGDYHFRFRHVVHGNAVWLDVSNEEAKIPMYEQNIHAKVTRISWASSGPREQPRAAAAAAPVAAPAKSETNNDLLQMFN